MVDSITSIFSFDFLDSISHIFNQCLRLHLGNIIYPRFSLTVWDNSANLSPGNIQISPGRFMTERIEGPVALHDDLLKGFGTAEVVGTVSSAVSFEMEVNKDIGIIMANWCIRILQRY